MRSYLSHSFIVIIWLVAIVLAEPPVGDGYAAARSDFNHDHDHDHTSSDHQRSLSQEYGVPSESYESARNAPTDGYNYNAPNRRNSNARGRSFPPATVRVSYNQKFRSAAARKSNQASGNQQNSRTISEQYGAPESRSLSQQYGPPAAVSARTLSTEYGMPDARSAPSQEYGSPIVAARNQQAVDDQSSSSHHAAAPASHSQNDAGHGYSTGSSRSQGYDTTKPTFGARSAPSPRYGAPSSRSHSSHAASRRSDSETVDSMSETYGVPEQKEVSKTYGVPEQKEVSATYGVPNARSSTQEPEVPSSIANLMTDAVVSSFASISSRSSPSPTYLPAGRSAPPSEQYGAPQQRDGAGQGYDYARARALEEELRNQEPASYDFGYQIEDPESGSDFGHSESREADRAQGTYFVVRPDGSKQTVEYEADEDGFRPRISVQPAGARAGYDSNAQDLSRSGEGPY